MKTTSELLSDIAGGNSGALGELYDALSAKLFNYTLAITRNRELSGDITHDVFLQVNASAAKIAAVGNPDGYIMTMVRNHAYNLLKREKRITALPQYLAERADEQDERFELEHALERLTPVRREAVHLHLVCGYTHKECAEILKTPLPTVKWRYARALDDLRNMLGDRKEIGNEQF